MQSKIYSRYVYVVRFQSAIREYMEQFAVLQTFLAFRSELRLALHYLDVQAPGEHWTFSKTNIAAIFLARINSSTLEKSLSLKEFYES